MDNKSENRRHQRYAAVAMLREAVGAVQQTHSDVSPPVGVILSDLLSSAELEELGNILGRAGHMKAREDERENHDN